jgi:hypothetical protein
MLFHLIYVSTAVIPMGDEDLVYLLKQSRARNARNRVTGMLLYKDGHFMQVLEGDEANVMKIFADIERDLRHKSVDVLRTEYIQHRDFPDWTMSFRNVDKIDLSTAPGLTRFLEHEFKSKYFCEDFVEAHAMLLAFKDTPETMEIAESDDC